MARTQKGNYGLGYKLNPDVSRTSVHAFTDAKEAKGSAVWTIQCIVVLISFLKSHVPGDGQKYKPKVLRDAAAFLNSRIIFGGVKKEKGVADKLREVRVLFYLIAIS